MNHKINHKLWLKLAVDISTASTCRVNVGCVLVHNNELVGTGYVGSISGDEHCNDVGCIFVNNHGEKGSSNSGLSCIRTLHAEQNAVLRCKIRGSAQGGWIHAYCTHAPCLECLKNMLAIGVRRVFYLKPYKDSHRSIYLSEISKKISNTILLQQHYLDEEDVK